MGPRELSRIVSRVSLIIPAGGTGSRFRKSVSSGASKGGSAALSKLLMPLAGKPLLVRTLETFQQIPAIREIIVAVPPSLRSAIAKKLRLAHLHGIQLVAGGRTRAESVWKALQKTSAQSQWVLVHDGARPLIRIEDIRKLLKERAEDALILARRVVPTIKEVDPENRVARTLDRSALCEAETPQLVRKDLLVRAYRELPNALDATDEASLVEALGGEVKVLTHDGWNPKVTTYKDFELAEAYLKSHSETRTGFGRDLHRLVAGRKFYLGGVRIPFDKGPLGHSDGDALLHAITDAVLGVMGKGDIGDWFSDRNPKYKNIQSTKLLEAVLGEAQKDGWKVEHVDTVTVLERPKLGPHKKKMQQHLAKILGLAIDAVSIKAKTAEGLGPEGKGLAVSAEAVVTMTRTRP